MWKDRKIKKQLKTLQKLEDIQLKIDMQELYLEIFYDTDVQEHLADAIKALRKQLGVCW